MAQQIMTCMLCGRERYESRVLTIRAHGRVFQACASRESCKVAARASRKAGM